MKNIYIPILLVLIFNACVQKYDICENPRMTGELIVKESYPVQDSVRISTKNIRINNKTITEFKKLGQFNTKDIFRFNISNFVYPGYVLNDTSINFKIPTGQYSFQCLLSDKVLDWYCSNWTHITYTGLTCYFSVTADQ